MYATLRADAHVAAGRKWSPGPKNSAPMNPLKVTMPPVLAGAAPERGLRGRRSECEALDRLVADLRAGQSQVLVLHGEAGVGKTALLEYLLERASGCCLTRTAGVESEMELAFAGLHQLCAPFLDRLERLPGPQRDALSTAFNLRDGDTPDRFAVGLAVLSLLSEVAGERPLVCVVDDAHWLDRASAQALMFVARHLSAQSAAVVFAVREPGEEQDLTGLAELAVRGLPDGDARAGGRSDRGRDARQPVGPAGGGPGSDAGGTGGRIRHARRSGLVEPDRGRLPAAADHASAGDAIAPAGRRGRAALGPGPGMAGGRSTRSQGRSRGGGGLGRAHRVRRTGEVPSSAGPCRRLPGGLAGGTPECPPRSRRGRRP